MGPKPGSPGNCFRSCRSGNICASARRQLRHALVTAVAGREPCGSRYYRRTIHPPELSRNRCAPMTGRLPADEPSKVLDAAAACYLRLGLAKTTAAEIAKAAGISRATLYRRFGSQEDIFFAVLERESEAMAEEAHDYLATFTDPGQRLVESIMFSISQMHNRPVHSAIFTGESAAWATQRAILLAMIRRITARGLRLVMKVAAQDPDGGKPASSEGLSDE